MSIVIHVNRHNISTTKNNFLPVSENNKMQTFSTVQTNFPTFQTKSAMENNVYKHSITLISNNQLPEKLHSEYSQPANST